ncbi:putative DNA-directed RNA polymerase II large subunit [Babesia bovis T2Bo]|uniref:putative DNA-directed RNA polymerase II large subunit n=1 Tax=Babesia bovis T2Bo TaxID=484906 RepID=UPI001DF4E761|nr:putative DNA-directed RNA polymerase II large subunit [Babesia bovis T2Bo]EDO05935.2 putative DNA-directed RNA polymerase II large subunit [Babesia bovis T2Bo]
MKRTQTPVESISLDKLNEEIIDATIDRCIKFANPRILETVKQRWTQVLRQRLDAVNRGEQFTHSDQVTSSHYKKPEHAIQQTPKVEELEDEFSENEFEDAEVETSMSQQTVNSCSVIAGISTVTSEPIPAATEPEQTDDTTECEDDMEILDVSDLDDQEPETKDIVIGIIDKISRPSTKKTTAPTWKVKLKYGILQINGVEIPFDNLEGEFEF